MITVAGVIFCMFNIFVDEFFSRLISPLYTLSKKIKLKSFAERHPLKMWMLSLFLFYCATSIIGDNSTLKCVMYGIAVLLHLEAISSIDRREKVFLVLSAFESKFQDPKDVYFLDRTLSISLLIFPLYVAVFNHFIPTILLVPLFFNAIFRLGLHMECILHHDIHLGIFDKFPLIRLYCRLILCPLFFFTSGQYFSHHIRNHHTENMRDDDITSLKKHYRSSFFQYCRASFKFGISYIFCVDLTTYLLKNKHYLNALQLILGLATFYGWMYFVYLHNMAMGIVLFYMFSGSGIVVASVVWRWHCFIDPAQPDNIFLNTSDNHYFLDQERAYYPEQLSFYASYHIVHHLFQKEHYTKYPRIYQKLSPLYKKYNAIVFNQSMPIVASHFRQLLWEQRFDLLASYCVNFSPEKQTTKDIEAILRYRTLPSLDAKEYEPRNLEKWLIRLVRMLTYHDMTLK